MLCRNLRLNSTYYIVKCLIPALNRPLSLVGVDTSDWYGNIPRPTSRPINAVAFIRTGKAKPTTSRMEDFFKSSTCINCGARDSHEFKRAALSIRLCQVCSQPGQKIQINFNLKMRLREIESVLTTFRLANHNHNGIDGPVEDLFCEDAQRLSLCWSFDCPLFWKAVSLRQNEVDLFRKLQDALSVLEDSL